VNQSIQSDIAQFMPIAVASGLFVSLATVTKPPTGQGPTGNPPAGPYTPVSSALTNIQCMDAPPSIARIQATEMKDVAEIMSKGFRHVLLAKCFLDAPDWSGLAYRVIVDGIEYDLLGAENDSQLTQTRVDLQLVSI
jgi:hypothetical protein